MATEVNTQEARPWTAGSGSFPAHLDLRFPILGRPDPHTNEAKSMNRKTLRRVAAASRWRRSEAHHSSAHASARIIRPDSPMSRLSRLFLIVAFLALALSACSPLDALNRASDADHYAIEADRRYGDAVRQTLDVYRPKAALADSPVVVFFYGGGWRDGNKADYEFVASTLSESGYTVVIPDYRLYPAVRFPAFVEDGATAVAWADRELVAGSNRPLVLMGHSAGAHIAALLALDGAYLERAGSGVDRIAGWIGLSGPYDFLPIESGYLLDVFPAATRPESQPINYATGKAPPTLLVHGLDDTTVEPGNSRRLARALREAGVPITDVEQEDTAHAATVAALAAPLEFVADTREVVVRFIDRLERMRQDR
jgi:acetyl esterase/lipase